MSVWLGNLVTEPQPTAFSVLGLTCLPSAQHFLCGLCPLSLSVDADVADILLTEPFPQSGEVLFKVRQMGQNPPGYTSSSSFK